MLGEHPCVSLCRECSDLHSIYGSFAPRTAQTCSLCTIIAKMYCSLWHMTPRAIGCPK